MICQYHEIENKPHMVSALIMASKIHNTKFHTTNKSCLRLLFFARPYHLWKQKSPQLRGLSGFLCLILLDYSRRGIISTQSSQAAYSTHHK